MDAAPSAVDAADAGRGRTRSRLYPSGWSPGMRDEAGRFLHDFSYAGYRNGERPLPTIAGPLFDVARFGAAPSTTADQTAAFQAALDAAAVAGGVVIVPAGTYRLDGVLTVTRSGVVLRGQGADRSRLWFTRTAGMSDRAHISFTGAVRGEAPRPLATDAAALDREVRLADTAGLAVGDAVSVGWAITPEFIAAHGMTGVWTAFVNQWKPIFRRRVVAIDRSVSPHRVRLDVPLRYPAQRRDQAGLRRETGYLGEVGVEDLGISSAAAPDAAWTVVRSHVIALNGVADGWVRGVRSFASPHPQAAGKHLLCGGLLVRDSARVTVSDTELRAAQNRGEGGSGYLFEIGTSSEILVRDSVGAEGRHNFIQNWDFGTSGCAFLRVHTAGGRAFTGPNDPLPLGAASEFHHSLAMACLIDGALIDDGWQAQNRLYWSSGAGHTATEIAFWNSRGEGAITSLQYGWGYVIGTRGVGLYTDPRSLGGDGTAPVDYVELEGEGDRLEPESLYEDQLRLRRERGELLWPTP